MCSSSSQTDRLDELPLPDPSPRPAAEIVDGTTGAEQTHSQASGASGAIHDAGPRPFVHVVRYCGLDEASTTAAIRQAVEILDAFVAAQGASPIEALIIVYRNRLPGAITLEIGAAVSPAIAEKVGGELIATTTPSGPMVSVAAQPGFAGLLQAADHLTTGGGSGPTYFWQVFGAEAFRPWRGYPQADVKAPRSGKRSPTRTRAARSSAAESKT